VFQLTACVLLLLIQYIHALRNTLRVRATVSVRFCFIVFSGGGQAGWKSQDLTSAISYVTVISPIF